MIHDLKVWPEYYAPLDRGEKTLELRLNDRNYQVGDVLLLREYEPMGADYTGRECRRLITHIVHGGEWLRAGYVAMSIREYDNEQ